MDPLAVSMDGYWPGRVRHSLVAGACGAIALTSVHELARTRIRAAPRMDVAGARALRRVLGASGLRPPRGRRLRAATIAGDLVGNALWYALVGLGRGERAVERGLLLGVLAGAGGVFLTPRLGLGSAPVKAAARTPWLTAAWYALGGVTAGVALRALRRRAAAPAR